MTEFSDIAQHELEDMMNDIVEDAKEMSPAIMPFELGSDDAPHSALDMPAQFD